MNGHSSSGRVDSVPGNEKLIGLPFPVLGNSSYMTYIGPLTNLGANPSTHLADVRYAAHGAPVISVVKLLPADGLKACNEALAWLFLHAAGISCPKNAAILTLSESKVVKILGRKRVPHHLVQGGKVMAWAAQQLEFKSIQALFAGTQADTRWLGVLRTLNGAAIAAFDEAFLNIDRNTGNILFTSASSCVPIDHEMTFGTQNWLTGTLTHLPKDGDSLRTLKNAASSGKMPMTELNTIYNRMAFHAQRHSQAMDECRAQMAQLIAKVYPKQADDLTSRVLSFIAERTALAWMEERLGVV